MIICKIDRVILSWFFVAPSPVQTQLEQFIPLVKRSLSFPGSLLYSSSAHHLWEQHQGFSNLMVYSPNCASLTLFGFPTGAYVSILVLYYFFLLFFLFFSLVCGGLPLLCYLSLIVCSNVFCLARITPW